MFGAARGNLLERNVAVRTPESIAFYYELAGLGSRFLAVAVDTVIQALAAIGVLLLLAWAQPGATQLGKMLGLRDEAIVAVEEGIAILLLFMISIGYFIAFESLWNGQTPGKRAIGIRVVRDGGYPLTFLDAVIRNFIRIIEAALIYVPSAISAVASSQNKRLGDLAAGTIVVRDRTFEVTDARRWMTHEPLDGVPTAGWDRITDDEFALAERYAARSHMLDLASARETAGRIAQMIRPKLGPEAAAWSDHDLLVRVAAGRPR